VDFTNQLRELQSQKRIKLFLGANQQNYLYDAYSQNIFPVKKIVGEILSGTSVSSIECDEKQIHELLDYLLRWDGKINYHELSETHLTINLSNKCNLNCSYCYRDKNNKNEMNLEKAFEIIDYADKYYKTNNNEIVFTIDMTGESFFDKEKIEAIYQKIQKYKNHQKMRLWFMSNGTKITEDYIELIRKIPIDPFWISLDGPKEINNINRKYYDGKSSFNDVIDNVKKLQENKINIKISCVLTKDYPYPDKLFNYFKTLNAVGIQICPVRNGCAASLGEDDIELVKQSYIKLYEQIYLEILKGDFSSVNLLKEDFVMQPIYNLFNRIRQVGRCTWGQEVVVDSKGNMYPCLYVIGNKKYLLGNIGDKLNAKDILYPITVKDRKKCGSCWARFLCGGTCHFNSIISKNSEYEIDDIECELRLLLVTESIKLIIKLMENGADVTTFAKTLNCK
jgi:uncharacterized protein